MVKHCDSSLKRASIHNFFGINNYAQTKIQAQFALNIYRNNTTFLVISRKIVIPHKPKYTIQSNLNIYHYILNSLDVTMYFIHILFQNLNNCHQSVLKNILLSFKLLQLSLSTFIYIFACFLNINGMLNDILRVQAFSNLLFYVTS